MADTDQATGSVAEAPKTEGNSTSRAGDNDLAVSKTANPSAKQVTQSASSGPAEGERIRKEARANDEGPVTLADVLVPSGDVVKYDDAGRLVTKDGKPIAVAADATDPDVGWTVQQARGDNPVQHQSHLATVPDQTVHPDELPDPLAALQAGLAPQNVNGLNIDKDKFKGKKPLEA